MDVDPRDDTPLFVPDISLGNEVREVLPFFDGAKEVVLPLGGFIEHVELWPYAKAEDREPKPSRRLLCNTDARTPHVLAAQFDVVDAFGSGEHVGVHHPFKVVVVWREISG